MRDQLGHRISAALPKTWECFWAFQNPMTVRDSQRLAVNANQVFSWRRQYRQGLLGKRNALPVNLLPVHVSEARRLCDALLTTAPSKVSIYFPSGHSRVGQWKRSAESCASATRATDAPGFKVCST